MKPAVLFVDDSENILQGLRRSLRPVHQEWVMHFAVNGVEALKILKETPIDVIVSDIRMPVMDGVVLLKEAKELYGQTVRLVLSGQCEEEAIAMLLEVSHQYLTKPLDTAALIAIIKGILAAKAQLQDEELKKFITSLAALPSLPVLHETIIEELQEPTPIAQNVENLLLRDISLVAKIFQVMNSSYFGATQDINTISYLWELLGLERIKTLILNGHIIAPLEKSLEDDQFITDLWHLSLTTARVARVIAKTENLPLKTCDKVWVGGLLHAIGAAILHMYRRQKGSVDTADLLDAKAPCDSYPLTGGFLAFLWGLPQDIRNVILHHAAPEKAGVEEGDRDVLAIVHVAYAIARAKANPATTTEDFLNEDFLRQADVLEKLNGWKVAASPI